MNKTKRQRYVPQGYLLDFSSDFENKQEYTRV